MTSGFAGVQVILGELVVNVAVPEELFNCVMPETPLISSIIPTTAGFRLPPEEAIALPSGLVLVLNVRTHEEAFVAAVITD